MELKGEVVIPLIWMVLKLNTRGSVGIIYRIHGPHILKTLTNDLEIRWVNIHIKLVDQKEEQKSSLVERTSYSLTNLFLTSVKISRPV